MQLEKFSYDNKIVRKFTLATWYWGVGRNACRSAVSLASLFVPELNFNIPFLTFGRIRPLHTNAVIFAFVGNAMFAGIYYSLQRLCKARMFSDVAKQNSFLGMAINYCCCCNYSSIGNYYK